MFKRLSTELALTNGAMFSGVVIAVAGAVSLLHVAHNNAVLMTIAALGVAGSVSLYFGSWFTSRRIAGPISALQAAAARLAQNSRVEGKLLGGDLIEVRVKGRNELAALASHFNSMSGELAARERRILQLSRQDAETGLPNLAGLEARLAELRAGVAPQEIFAAAIVIDRFQHLRSAIGHSLSSRLIAEIAGRISSSYSELFVGRISADTIGLVFHAESADAAMQTIIAASTLASQPLRLDEDRIETRVTGGVACDADAPAKPSLFERAEIAVEQARGRRIRAAAFDAASYGDPADAMSLMNDMILGLSRGEFFLAYQPRYDLRAGRVVSAEALLRWRHPQRGLIAPDRFIPLAETIGHIRPVTDWVIDRVIADQRVLRAAGRDMPLSINISGSLIANEAFAQRTLRQIRRAGARLSFEITEAAVIDNPRLALDVMAQLRAAGVELAIDDYGSNLSSLSCLRTIPAQELKIDRTFIESMAHGNSDALLVKSAIDLAHSLGMRVAAEGVETADALSLLQIMGADLAQGYYIAHPMPLDDLLKFEPQLHEAPRLAPAIKSLA